MMMKTEDFKNKIKEILENKKAEEIAEIFVREKTSITDYFVIASGKSITQVKSLAENLDFELSKIGIEPKRIEGYKDCKWILMDYGDVIVHIFLQEVRNQYSLEDLWNKNN